MDERKDVNTGFSIENIILIESNFKRQVFIDFKKAESSSNTINISIGKFIKDDGITLEVSVEFGLVIGDKEQAKINVKMVGVFTRLHNAEISSEEFAENIGPAIIYPFIREHISSLSLRAAIGTIFIPPISFIRPDKQKLGT